MIEWIIIVGLVVAMYIVIYKYEKKMDAISKKIDENKAKIDYHCHKLNEHDKQISKNCEKLDEHNNHINKMWLTIPKSKE